MKHKTNFLSKQYRDLAIRTDRLFAGLLVFEWALGILFALWISPKTWNGSESEVHVHVYAAILVGAIATVYPVFQIWKNPGAYSNRFIVAIAQITYSVLFTHLTGGRIETHFHIFGSLAFLAFYRDLKPLALATALTAADHLLRGIYFPQSVYGVLTAAPWRALEHSAWVLFEDAILYVSILHSREEMRELSERQAELARALENVEEQVQTRTKELLESQQMVWQQQKSLAASAKMSALGEMASGIAHEINTPLTIIQIRNDQLIATLKEEGLTPETASKSLQTIDQTVKRIAKIVSGLRTFSRDGHSDPLTPYAVSKIVEDTFSLCRERFQHRGVQLTYTAAQDIEIDCRPGEIAQVLLNMLNNSHDAIQSVDDKWIKVDLAEREEEILLSVTDSGSGIPMDVQKKMLEPFFTTKEMGKGTGLGLSISNRIIGAHGGKIEIDNSCANTRIVLRIPRRATTKTRAAA